MNQQPVFENLESRELFTAVYPTALEQYELELINRARANPTAEANRYHIKLNEGLSAGTISTAAKQPLAFSPLLVDSARKHSAWMILHDTFSHYEGSKNPGDRMTAAGYKFTGSYTWGENIAYRSSRPTAPNPVPTAAQLEQDLFVDKGISGRGHRTNLMNANYKEIGVGFATGDFSGYKAQILSEDFATTGTGSFLTGVAYADTKTKDHFYSVGEGLSGVTIKAKRASDGKIFTTKSWASGGYSLKLSAGTYSVTASGGRLKKTISFSNVKISAVNVKKDFVPA